jgi:transketolase
MSKYLDYAANKIKLDKRSCYLRSLIVDCIKSTRRGHIGSAMSLVEILRVLYDDIITFESKNPSFDNRDRVVLSKGHGCLALYSILADKNFFSKNILKDTCKFDSILGGHPESNKIPGVEASTGSLGHGLPIAVGLAIAAKLKNKKFRTMVILGDGEINEGSNWEAFLSASKHKLDNLLVLIDYNKIQSYDKVSNVLNLEPLLEKLESFNLHVEEANGHDIIDLKKKIKKCLKVKGKPKALICHTVKGKGLSFAENNPEWHHKNNISDETFALIDQELNKII